MLKIEDVEFTADDVTTIVELLGSAGLPGSTDVEVARNSGFRPEVVALIRSAWILSKTPSPKKHDEAARPGVTTVDDLDRAYILRRSRIGDSVDALAARLDLSVEVVQSVINAG